MIFKILPVALIAASLVQAQVPLALLRERALAIETEPTRLRDGVKMEESGMDFPPAVTEARLREINASILPDGRFKGVDYESKNPSMWKTTEHLDRCRELAIGQAVFNNQQASLNTCLKGLDWWLATRPKNSNWWQHTVYEAQMLGSIALLLPKEALTPERRAGLEDFLKRPKPGMTGQNRLWLCWNTILAGLFMEDAPRVAEALREMGGVIVVAKPGQEGIQPDWSFHQHGPHFYQGNYGRHFLHSASKYLRLTAGTPFENREQAAAFEHMLLDGTRMMCWGGLLDYNAWGRQISYAARFQGPDIRIACRNFLATRPARAAEILAYSNELKALPFNGARSKTPRGSFAYPASDYLAHRAESFMVGLRLASTRSITMECVNGDNAMGDFLSQGQTYIYRTGMEYAGVFPLWNWACIPGTTARNITVKSRTGGRAPRGGSDFAVVSPDGAAAMRLDYKGVTANKSWFFFDDRMVCLGSGIASKEPGEVLTTLDQSMLVKGAKPLLKTGKTYSYVDYNGFYWMAPAESRLRLEESRATGNWRPIRPANPDATVEGDVFFLTLSHGEAPQAGTYFYQVVNKSGSPDAAWADIRVLRQDEVCHAVHYKGRGVKCAFFKPGELTLPGGRSITAEKPGIQTVESL